MTTLEETATSIESAVRLWRDRLRRVNGNDAHVKPAQDRWSISEVIGHLVDSACNNHQRFVRAQECDELEFPKYDQNAWVAAANYRTLDWETVIELWYTYNVMIAHLLRNISEMQLSKPCTITPYDTCTLGYLITDYLYHMNHHLDILDGRLP